MYVCFKTIASVKGFANGVCGLDFLPSTQIPKHVKRDSAADYRYISPVVFCGGKTIYEVEFQ